MLPIELRIPIYSLVEGVSAPTKHRVQTCKGFSILVGVELVRGAIPLQIFIYTLKSIHTTACTCKSSLPTPPTGMRKRMFKQLLRQKDRLNKIHYKREHGLNKSITTLKLDRLNNLSRMAHKQKHSLNIIYPTK